MFSIHSIAQVKYDYNWLFGYDTDLGVPGGDGADISFNEDTVSISYVQRDMYISFTNASISDSLGNLLFYTNGCYIANAEHEMMENGDSLNPGQVHEDQCDHGYTAREGVLIIPKPGSLTEFFLFHLREVYTTENGFSVRGIPLYYTTVDMTYNNGLGKVTQKNQILINDTIQIGNLNAIRHENGTDWWVINLHEEDGAFYSLLVKSDTIEGPFIQEVPLGNDFNNGGQSVFSPDGTRYANYKVQDGVYIYGFDRSTGLVDSGQYIPLEEYTVPGGCAFSSNSRFLYVNTVTNIYQFDLEADDIEASKILVAEWDGYHSPFPTSFYFQQLGPDCRIYLNSPNGVDVLHVINHPNRPGLECEVIQHGVQLPTPHLLSLPNFPHYRTGTQYPVCDSTIVLNITTPIFDLPDPVLLQLSVFPNPASEQITIRLTEPVEDELIWRLYDALGQEVIQQRIAPFEAAVEVSVGHLPRGMYFYRVTRQGIIVANGKVVVE